MTRIARVVIAGCPHHITQRGNNGQDVFFVEADYGTYLRLLKVEADRHGLDVIGYCLMTNHVHLIATPRNETALAKALGRTHWIYARYVNRLNDRSGHLWQNRFYSCALDEGHLWRALAYVERNPVRAGLVTQAWDYRWSSAAAHCAERQDRHGVCAFSDFPLDIPSWWRVQTPDTWRAALREVEEPDNNLRIRSQTQRGWPLGSDEFLTRVEKLVGRPLRPQPGKSGRSP